MKKFVSVLVSIVLVVTMLSVGSYAKEPSRANLLGDVNEDNTINSLDALIVLRYSAEIIGLTPEEKIIADVNKDGYVTSSDALLILQYAVGQIEEF